MAFPRPGDTRSSRDGSARPCVVLASNGELLSHGLVGRGSGPSTIVLDQASARGALLGYYFARGLRDVIVRIGDFQLQGRLRTSWEETHREWTIELEPIRSQRGAA